MPETFNGSCLAAVFHGPDQPLELQKLSLPGRLAPGEILVRVSCCTLCGSDLSTLAGHRQEPVPCILGHEILGIVEAIGPEVVHDLRERVVEVGDRVVWSVAASCDVCRYCTRGVPQKCVELRKYGHQRLTPAWQLSGGLSEYCQLVRGTKILVVGPEVADEALCPASCATATVAAALRTSGAVEGARVLVFGAGLLGLTACAMAKAQQAQSVTICDPSAERLQLATRFAADHTLGWEEFPQSEGSSQFDLVLEMSGNVQAVRTALTAGDIGASVVLVGSVRPTAPVEFLPEVLVRRVLSVHGVHNYRPQDLVTAVDFLTSPDNTYPFAELVSCSFPLADINTAVNSPQRHQAIRIAIKP